MPKIPKSLKTELIWLAAQQLRIRLTAWLARRKKRKTVDIDHFNNDPRN